MRFRCDWWLRGRRRLGERHLLLILGQVEGSDLLILNFVAALPLVHDLLHRAGGVRAPRIHQEGHRSRCRLLLHLQLLREVLVGARGRNLVELLLFCDEVHLGRLGALLAVSLRVENLRRQVVVLLLGLLLEDQVLVLLLLLLHQLQGVSMEGGLTLAVSWYACCWGCGLLYTFEKWPFERLCFLGPAPII